MVWRDVDPGQEAWEPVHTLPSDCTVWQTAEDGAGGLIAALDDGRVCRWPGRDDSLVDGGGDEDVRTKTTTTTTKPVENLSLSLPVPSSRIYSPWTAQRSVYSVDVAPVAGTGTHHTNIGTAGPDHDRDRKRTSVRANRLRTHWGVAASGDDGLRLFDPTTLELLGFTEHAHASDINCAAICPSDTSLVATASDDGSVRLWRISPATGEGQG